MTEKRERITSAFLGAAVGDALGWPKERAAKRKGKLSERYDSFEKWQRSIGGQYNHRIEIVNAGEYSDDTQLFLCTARSVLHFDWWKHFSLVELPFWDLYQRGAGAATRAAVKTWTANRTPWDSGKPDDMRKYFDAGGNGVAMRIFPHVVERDKSFADIHSKIVQNGIATHGHPRALLGALAYGFAAHHLMEKRDTLRHGELVDIFFQQEEWCRLPYQGNKILQSWTSQIHKYAKEPFYELWKRTVQEILELLAIARESLSLQAASSPIDTLRRLGCFSEMAGSGTISAVAAIYLASNFAAKPFAGVIESTKNPDMDTDTIGSMTCALLGALHGEYAFSGLASQVQDYEYIRNLARRVAVGEKFEVTGLGKPVGLPALKKQLLSSKSEDDLILPDGRFAKVSNVSEIISGRNKYTNIRVRTSDGQELLFPMICKVSEEKPLAHVKGKALEGNLLHLQPVTVTQLPLNLTINTHATNILLVDDLNASKVFFCAFGLVPHRESPDRFDYPNFSIATGEYLPPDLNLSKNSHNRLGGYILRISVKNLNIVRASLRQLPVKIVELPDQNEAKKRFFCFDFDNHLIEVFEAAD